MPIVMQSFERARERGLARRFYERFLSADPAVRQRFASTDFQVQSDLLMHGVFAMLEYSRGRATGKMAIERLCKSHGPAGMAIPRTMFATWERCFLATLADTDPQFDDALEAAWQEALGPALRRLEGCCSARNVGEPHRARPARP